MCSVIAHIHQEVEALGKQPAAPAPAPADEEEEGSDEAKGDVEEGQDKEEKEKDEEADRRAGAGNALGLARVRDAFNPYLIQSLSNPIPI